MDILRSTMVEASKGAVLSAGVCMAYSALVFDRNPLNLLASGIAGGKFGGALSAVSFLAAKVGGVFERYIMRAAFVCGAAVPLFEIIRCYIQHNCLPISQESAIFQNIASQAAVGCLIGGVVSSAALSVYKVGSKVWNFL
jgi:hypothetical protein